MVEQQLPKLATWAEIRHPVSKTAQLTAVSFQYVAFWGQNKMRHIREALSILLGLALIVAAVVSGMGGW